MDTHMEMCGYCLKPTWALKELSKLAPFSVPKPPHPGGDGVTSIKVSAVASKEQTSAPGCTWRSRNVHLFTQRDRNRHVHVDPSTTLRNPGCLFTPSSANSQQQLLQEDSKCFLQSFSAKLFISEQWRVNVFCSGWLKARGREEQNWWQVESSRRSWKKFLLDEIPLQLNVWRLQTSVLGGKRVKSAPGFVLEIRESLGRRKNSFSQSRASVHETNNHPGKCPCLSLV